MHSKPLNGVGVVVTRPIDQAKMLTALIADAGGEVIDFPLIAITPLSDYSFFKTVIADLAHIDWIIFISSNAVNRGFPLIKAQWPTLPSTVNFAAIGPVTAETLASYGVEKVLIPQGRFDSEALLSMDVLQNMQDQQVMIVRGVGGREVLAKTLQTRGANVVFAECYQRTNPQTDCQMIQAKFEQGLCQVIVVTSSEAMRHLIEMVDSDRLLIDTHWIKLMKICVNHQRVADEAQGYGLQLFVADAPGDEAMLRCIKKAIKAIND